MATTRKANLHGHQALILDDEPDIVEEVVDLLDCAGYPCLGAHTAEQALALFQANPGIDMLILDFDLQDSQGPRVLERMQALAGRARLFEAITISGRAGKDELIDVLRSGFCDFLAKPLNPEHLLAALEKLAEKLEERARDRQRVIRAESRLDVLTESLKSLASDAKKAINYASTASRPARGEPSKDDEALLNTPEDQLANPFFAKLSLRQLDVVRLIGKGLSNYQIACKLGISEHTVKLYVSQSLRLTGLSNRTQLALKSSPRRKANHDL
ncbi:two-component response regulator, PprB [Pseudomonas citronellolis]|uniref:response regulator n=1 Tax=Pseudomonas citronellolis TaxID=53408 RepID=UPI000EC84AE2|nr:response regulator [Pseudomonas citronellolis]GBL53249.1 two-component response regulator, PprB [Pseudomonas citronellolis]